MSCCDMLCHAVTAGQSDLSSGVPSSDMLVTGGGVYVEHMSGVCVEHMILCTTVILVSFVTMFALCDSM